MPRTEVIAGLSLYVIGRIVAWSYYGRITGHILAAILTLLFINPIRGTFKYHNIINSRILFRNVIILNSLRLIYSLIALITLFEVSEIGGYIETMSDELGGLIIMSLVFIAYCLTLMRFMPFTKNRAMVDCSAA